VKLAYLLRYFPTVSETFVYDELLELARVGEGPQVWAADRTDAVGYTGLETLASACGFVPRAHQPSVLRYATSRSTLADTWSAWGNRPKDLRRAHWLASRLADDGVQHLHVHFAAEMAEWAWVVQRDAGIPYTLTVHARDLYCPRPSLADVLASARRVVTISEYNAAHLRALGLPPDRVTVVRQGLELPPDPGPRPSRGDRPLRVLSVGRLVAKKGHDLLVEAVGALAADGHDLHLDLVGDGPLAGRLASLAAEHEAPVTWHGAQPRERVLDLLGRADLFVLACRMDAEGDRDGIPVSLMEAMARRVPVVSTDVSGIPELVENDLTGCVVPPDDGRALAAVMASLDTDPARCVRLAAEARSRVQAEHDLARQVRRLLHTIRSA